MKTQPSNSRVDLWVFRDGRRPIRSSDLIADLKATVRKLRAAPGNESAALDAVIRAGEFESALADEGIASREAGALTDALAKHMVTGSIEGDNYDERLFFLEGLDVPRTLLISPPEGFSFYCLNPKDLVGSARNVCKFENRVAVIGIRSIGITLSATVAAALSSPRRRVNRISVRPTGHPYDRVLEFNKEQMQWIQDEFENGAHFLIVDEGPGRSGSTFLCVAEALAAHGVPESAITLLGTRAVNADELCAPDAGVRWRRFKFVFAEPESARRFEGFSYVGGGEWRNVFLPGQSAWPACWTQMERSKFLSPDKTLLFKFEGMGRIGEEVRARGDLLGRAGFGLPPRDAGGGYACYEIVKGSALASTSLSPAILEHLASYCAMRLSGFKVTPGQLDPISDMVKFNLGQELGMNADDFELPVEDLAIVDGRMQPHEWILSDSGKLFKCDAVSHGDDHFFPGPTDIVWDLAGATVEWNLSADASDFLLDRFSHLTRRNVRKRFEKYLVAYSVFRMSMCKMAVPTTADNSERARLTRDYSRYRTTVERLLRLSGVGPSEVANPGAEGRAA